MMKQTLLALTILLATNNAYALDEDHYAPPTTVKNYESAVKHYMHRILKDPDSMKDFSVSKPFKDSIDMTIINQGFKFLYASCVWYRAKNSYGAYNGLQSLKVYYSGDYVVGQDGDNACSMPPS